MYKNWLVLKPQKMDSSSFSRYGYDREPAWGVTYTLLKINITSIVPNMQITANGKLLLIQKTLYITHSTWPTPRNV
jgi:hypothetical protein